MSDAPFQVLLDVKGGCRRGIRYRELSSEEVDAVGNIAAEMAGAEATNLKLRQVEMREGVKHMLVAATKTADIADENALLKLPESDWHALDVKTLSTPDSPWCYEQVFTKAKDHAALARIYQKLHGVTADEVDAILGKAKRVSAG